MALICHSYVTHMYSHVIRVYLYVIRMSLVYHPYVTHMSLVCTCMSSVCHSYVLVCHQYVTRMYLYVIHMSLVCGFTMNLFSKSKEIVNTLNNMETQTVRTVTFLAQYSQIRNFTKHIFKKHKILVIIFSSWVREGQQGI